MKLIESTLNWTLTMTPTPALISLTLIYLFWTLNASATCRSAAGASLPFVPRASTLSALTVDPDAPTGSIIGGFNVTTSLSFNGGINCSSRLGWYDDTPFGNSLGNSVYATNLSGIGYRVYARGGFQPFSTYTGDRGGLWTGSTRGYELVKTGAISRGGTLSGLGFSTYIRSHNVTVWREIVPNITINFLTKPTCRLNNTSIPISFGIVPITATNGRLAQRPMYVPVTCSGGAPGTQTSVYMTLTDANNPGNRSNNLTIVPANSGMTINISHDGSPMYFGPASSAAGNPGQKLLSRFGNGTVNHYLVANLMRIGPMRGLPSFSARATMTMRYE
jgi:hypothetical protein